MNNYSLIPDIDWVFDKIGVTNKHCVEFGVYNFHDEHTSKIIKQDGWTATYIECDENQYQQIGFNCIGYPVTVVKRFITAENINDVFAEGQVPKEFDLLSIDVDGMDYWLWKALDYKPRVVFIEYNGVKTPGTLAVPPYNPDYIWNHTRYMGSSLDSITKLANEKGYELYGVDRWGATAFYILKEEFPKLGIEDNSVEKIFVHANYGVEADGGHPGPDGEYLEI
jgi:hypothetical protein